MYIGLKELRRLGRLLAVSGLSVIGFMVAWAGLALGLTSSNDVVIRLIGGLCGLFVGAYYPWWALRMIKGEE